MSRLLHHRRLQSTHRRATISLQHCASSPTYLPTNLCVRCLVCLFVRLFCCSNESENRLGFFLFCPRSVLRSVTSHVHTISVVTDLAMLPECCLHTYIHTDTGIYIMTTGLRSPLPCRLDRLLPESYVVRTGVAW